jgi:hypothetical protein
MIERRKPQPKKTNWVLSSIKATISVTVCSFISYLATWGVNTSSSIGLLDKRLIKVEDSVSTIEEKQQFLSNWMVDELKRIREEIKQTHDDLREIQRKGN